MSATSSPSPEAGTTGGSVSMRNLIWAVIAGAGVALVPIGAFAFASSVWGARTATAMGNGFGAAWFGVGAVLLCGAAIVATVARRRTRARAMTRALPLTTQTELQPAG